MDGKPAPRGTLTLTDPRAIRALAHPARLAVVDRLFAGEVLTATECARGVGLSASAMSYHLRALEKWGVVERAPATDARERPWRARGTDLRLGPAGGLEVVAARNEVADLMLHRLVESTRAALRRRAVDPDAPPLGLGNSWARLTGAQATGLAERLSDAADAYLAALRGGGPGDGGRADPDAGLDPDLGPDADRGPRAAADPGAVDAGAADADAGAAGATGGYRVVWMVVPEPVDQEVPPCPDPS